MHETCQDSAEHSLGTKDRPINKADLQHAIHDREL